MSQIDTQALRERKLDRNERVRKEYKTLKAKKTKAGSQKYSEAYILERIADKYFIAKKTVQNILNYHYEKSIDKPRNRAPKSDPNQINLFDILDEKTTPISESRK